MNPLLIEFNQAGYNADVSSLQSTIKHMQQTIEMYNKMDIGTFSKEDFEPLFYNTENFLFEQIMKDKPAVFAGMKINKKRFFEDYIEKPAGYHSMLKQVEDFTKQTTKKVERDFPYKSLKSYISFFNLLPDFSFEIKQEILDEVKRKYQVFVNSERAKQGYKVATVLKEMFNDPAFKKNIPLPAHTMYADFMSRIINRTGDQVEVNITFIQSLDHS